MHELDPARPPHELVAQHGDIVRELVTTNAVLFHGSWSDFAEDLRRRKAGRPYLFRFPFDPDETLQWIHRLQTYELARDESLAAALNVEGTL